MQLVKQKIRISSAVSTHHTTHRIGVQSPSLRAVVTAALVSTCVIGAPALAEVLGPDRPHQRAAHALKMRTDAAREQFQQPLPSHPFNNDEALAGRINSYTKGLPHDANGIVDPAAYQALITALDSGAPADFELIPMGVPSTSRFRNPQAAYTYFLEGKDPAAFTMPAAPAFGSAWQAADAIEVMWQALTRDVAFEQYGTNPLTADAATDLSRFTDYRGPSANGQVTPQTLFRGIGVGETVGPYISQFLYQPIPYGAQTVQQKYKVPKAGNDHLTNFGEWLLIQRGGRPSGVTTVKFDDQLQYIRNGRDLAQYVLQDFVNQSYLGAANILASYGPAAVAPQLPYLNSATQGNGPLFSPNHVIDMLSRVGMASQSQAWYQKWLVHRRARPEVFFGRVEKHLTDPVISYPIHADVLNSPALGVAFEKYGSYLLPMATPGGSPTHPSYPAGHATMAGAAVTMLKAFYNGSFVIPNPVKLNADGTQLVTYTGPALTIEGELNKLASNISLGRDIAGVHYRSDGDLGVILGEELAISILRDVVDTYNEDFPGFAFNRFDGTPVVIEKHN